MDHQEQAKVNPAKIVSGPNVQANSEAANFCRIFVSIFAGCACGILGFRGWGGVLFFLAVTGVSVALSLLRLQFDTSKFFRSKWDLVTAGLSPGAMSFVLFWTLLYNIVHIY